jgi:hypothetical protein
MTDLPCLEFLRLRRKGEVGIDLPVGEQLGASADGRSTKVTSLRGSRPTCASMLATKTWCVKPSSTTAIVLPLRSRIERIRSVPKSSKHPMWPPDTMTMGAPASIRMIKGATNVRSMSMWPAASASACFVIVSLSLTYSTSVKPSVFRSSSATYCGATQRPVRPYEILMRVVSGDGVASATFDPSPTRAAPANDEPVRNARRFIPSAPS